MIRVNLSREANKQYERLSNPDRAKIKKKLASLEQNPLSGKKLSGEYIGVRSVRAWPYRIIYSIDERSQTVEIISILHRQGAYK